MFLDVYLYEETPKRKRTRLKSGDFVLFQYQPSTGHLLVKFERRAVSMAFGHGKNFEWINDKCLVGRFAEDEIAIVNFIAAITGLKMVFIREVSSFRVYQLRKPSDVIKELV